jgi:hypothetical protein
MRIIIKVTFRHLTLTALAYSKKVRALEPVDKYLLF